MDTSPACRLAAVVCMIMLGACRTPMPSPTPPVATAPRLLLSSKPLQLAKDCVATESLAIDFVIEGNGSTTSIEVPPASDCLRRALRTWVASFKYMPQATAVSSRIEWLLVSAPRS